MKKRQLIKVVTALLMITSIGLLFYPTVSTMLNDKRNKDLITSYKEYETDETDFSEEIKAANDYNRAIPLGPVLSEKMNETDTEYEKLVNVNNDLSMGYIEIPEIAVTLPIFHYYSDSNVEGLGHIYGSSLPVGGEGTHSVLAAHRGVPSAKLLTDLDSLQKGDLFYIHTLGKVLTYEVDDIKVVLPADVKSLKLEEGKDYVTLVTCTPYGINTHRLLVRGSRVISDEKPGESTVINTIIHRFDVFQVIGIIIIITMFIIATKKLRKGAKIEKDSINSSDNDNDA